MLHQRNHKAASLILLLLLPLTFVQGQARFTHGETMAGIYMNGGWNLPVRLTTKYITEDTSPWYGYQSWSAGISFSFMAGDLYRLEIAPQYSLHKIGFELSPPIYDIKKIYTESFELLSIPVTLRRYLNYDFFISAGTVVDFAINGRPKWVDPQSGLGLTLGAGKEFIKGNIVMDISPGVELHSVVPFVSEDFQQMLLVCGLRIGICFSPERVRNFSDEVKKQEIIEVKEP
jgi:hypothetical protein